ncbi:hypothetical protein OG323_37120 (plasmid) [Streptomyces cyaneofuscatus]|uniref:hypothetical protein n=1 Tax=Streptomyces cyaneofuscatus TaxID=66883 RepID=UPI002F912F3C|nr:hypothetical protein OG323_00020 [Streptomyces cyaneofuscatus]WTA94223.1 hypothetical protein OG323_37085 [Streptomyces cyaneofuscatus]WTA94651.1 hypothetical protein OG323_37120 [Streptomyces cyaneofuscatus]
MNTTGERGREMNDERAGRTPESALTELRRRLEDGRVGARLKKEVLAHRAGLGRTTVYKAFKAGEEVPSASTVEALARVLKLEVPQMRELQRDALGGVGGEGLGMPIGQWEPHALEVHPSGPAPGSSGSVERRALPGYVRRAHDRVLAQAVQEAAQGDSRMVVLVGESSTGKTRACWEAVQPLAELGWRLWHPFDPTRAEAALEKLHEVGPRTVVWLNEAQHYLGDRAVGERVAAAVHALLVEAERGPVLVLGTLWPTYFKQYTALPGTDGKDPHSRVRELLAGRTESVSDVFDAPALAAASQLAEDGDVLLADALTRARADGRLCQDLAGVPVLLERYKNGSPAARALLEAAMDARRLGVGLHLPQDFLTAAALDYFHDSDRDQLTDDWAEKAYAELAEQVHGKQAALRRVTPRPRRRPPDPTAHTLMGPVPLLARRPPGLTAHTPQPMGPVLRLADSLEQYGGTSRRRYCPPASFWDAAHTHITQPEDLGALARAAGSRHRLHWAHHFYQRAAESGDTYALIHLAMKRESQGEREEAETLAQRAAERGDAYALIQLAIKREEAGDREGAETLYQRAAESGDTYALIHLAMKRESQGEREEAETLAQRAAERGDISAWFELLGMKREKAGDRKGNETLYHRELVADRGAYVLIQMVEMMERAGDREEVETLYQRAAESGDAYVLIHLAMKRESQGEREEAETLAQRATDCGDTSAWFQLAVMRERAEGQEEAETLYQRAADSGDAADLRQRAVFQRLWPYGLDPDGTPTGPWSAESEALPWGSSRLPPAS